MPCIDYKIINALDLSSGQSDTYLASGTEYFPFRRPSSSKSLATDVFQTIQPSTLHRYRTVLVPNKQCQPQRSDNTMRPSEHSTSADTGELARLPTDALRVFRDRQRILYETLCRRAKPLNLARGKPSNEQLDLSTRLLTAVSTEDECWSEDGSDCRNYFGNPQGLIESRRIRRRLMLAPRQYRRISHLLIASGARAPSAS
jgi:hypothetical protein